MDIAGYEEAAGHGVGVLGHVTLAVGLFSVGVGTPWIEEGKKLKRAVRRSCVRISAAKTNDVCLVPAVRDVCGRREDNRTIRCPGSGTFVSGGFPFHCANSRQARMLPFIPPLQAISRIAHLRKYKRGVTSPLGKFNRCHWLHSFL